MHFPPIYVFSIYVICSAMLIPNCLSLLTQNQTTSPRSSPRPLDASNINNTRGTVPLPSHTYGAAAPSIETDPNISASSGLFQPTVSVSSKFNPSMSIIIFVLLAAFFFMGVLSVYIRRCTSNVEQRRRNMNSNLFVRSALRGHLQPSENGSPSHGLDLILISSLPTIKFSKGKGLEPSLAEKGERIVGECVVCLSEFEDGAELRFLPKCGHCFHLDCIDMWLFSHTTCPLCRRSLLCEGKNTKELNRDVHEPLSLLLLT